MLRCSSCARGSRSIALAWLAISCASPRRPVPPPADDAKLPACAALRYLPLVDGNQWAYDAEDDETGETGMFVTRARRLPGPKFAMLSNQGSHTLEVRADGILRAESNAYLLKAPLTAGTEWPGEGGSMVHVGALDRIVDVPAGKFVGCIETIEEVLTRSGKDPARRVTTTYCPDVGVALLHAEVWRAGKHMGERATLRSFGKPVQFSDERPRPR
jgi:hypothetical protein